MILIFREVQECSDEVTLIKCEYYMFKKNWNHLCSKIRKMSLNQYQQKFQRLISIPSQLVDTKSLLFRVDYKAQIKIEKINNIEIIIKSISLIQPDIIILKKFNKKNLNNMGNKIIGKRPPDFYKGFNQDQLQYLRDKFQILKDQKGFLSKQKIQDAYKCNQQIANKSLKFIDFTDNGQVDEYQFICAVASFCNAPIERLGEIIFEIITDKKQRLDEKALENFTQTVLCYNSMIDNVTEPTQKQITQINKKKFRKYDYDKSSELEKTQFTKMCLIDQDYKKWMYYMGFISKRQMNNQQEIYNDVDSDIQNQIDRHQLQIDQNVDKLKKGIEHRIGQEKLTEFQNTQQVGQQALAAPSWRKAVQYAATSRQQNQNPPSQYLWIQYVYGYRSYDTRNNLKYNSRGKAVYHTAALGIVLDTKQNKQDFMCLHNDDITCLDIVDDIVVTGQMGINPTIVVWNSEKSTDGQLPIQFILNQGLINSIGNIVLSQSKQLLAANCNNQDHNIVIYDLKKLKQKQKDLLSKQNGIIAQGKATKSIILDLKFSKDQKTLIAATLRQILFFTFKNKILKSNRGIFNKFPTSSCLSLAVLDNNLTLSAMGNGSIYLWQKQNCSKLLNGHQTTVTALANRTDKKSILSGDKNGVIIIWNEAFEIQKTLQIPKIISSNPKIISLSMSKNTSILVGTRSGDIIQYKTGEKQPKRLMAGHYDRQLWALTVHPTSGCFYTGGEDKRLMKWRYKQKRLEKITTCNGMIRSIDVNINQNLLAVGLRNGVVDFYDAQTLQKKDKKSIINFKNPDRQVLSMIKFDKQGRYLAICYTPPNSMLYLYDLVNETKKSEVKMVSRILNLDFSLDSKRIQLNTSSYEYLCYNVPNLDQIKKLETIKDQTWSSYTLTLSYSTQGIFTNEVFQNDIHSCQVSPMNKNTIVVGDNYGKIKLFNFPSIKYPVYNKYKGHSSHITLVRFTKDEKNVISLGGLQKSIIQWKYEPNVVKNKFQSEKTGDYEKQDVEGEQNEIDEAEIQFMKSKQISRNKNQMMGQFQIEEQQGEQALANKAFLGQVFSPSNFVPDITRDNKLPQQQLEINHVFGVRNQYLTDQVRNQCKFSEDYKNIIFPTASLGIKQNIEKSSQTYFKGHQDDIVSFALDSKRKIAATGQMAQKNVLNPLKKIVAICVWSVETQQVLKKLDGFHTIAIVLLQFSPDSKLLFSCGNDEKNSYAIYQWKSGVILYHGPISRGKVNGIAWKTNIDFATCGNDHVKFWSSNKSQQGQIPGKSQAMFSIVSANAIYITGSGSGGLYNWVGGTSNERINGHKGKVHTLVVFNNNLYSGGDDGRILVWKMEKNGSIKTSDLYFDMRNAYLRQSLDKMNQNQFGVLSIDTSPETQLLIVTNGCDIILLNSKKKSKLIHSGHYKGQLWGLTVSPINDDLFITSGDDSSIRLWSISQKSVISREFIDGRKIRGIDWSNDGQNIVAADNKAFVYLYSNKLKQLLKQPYQTQINRLNKTKIDSWVQQIKFSPNSKLIAVGSHGKSNVFETLKVQNSQIKKYHIYKNYLTSALLHLDWSKDSDSFSTNSQSYELQFFDANAEKILKASSTRDFQWATWTRKFGFPVQGIFQGIDYSDINTVCADREKKILAVGYDDQTIRLFRYPAYIPKQVSKQYYGHSSHIAKVRFNKEKLISVGGNDRTIIIWDVIRSNKFSKSKKIEEQQAQEDIDYQIDLPIKAMRQKPKKEKEQDQFETVEEQGEEFMAIKPWLGAIKQPTYAYPKERGEKAPQINLELQYVYGYRSKDCRQNLFYYDKNTILYHAAAVVIFHNIDQNTQQLITQHNDDILSIAYNKEKDLILTGQLGPKPLVCLIQSQVVKKRWIAPVTKGVLCLGISPAGTRGVCVGMDTNHQIAVIDLSMENKVQYKVDGGKQIILKAEWVNEQQFVTVGIKHFKYWKIQAGKLKAKVGKLKNSFVSLAIKDDIILTGSENSQLTLWKESQEMKTLSIRTKKEQDANTSSIIEAISIEKNIICVGTKNKMVFILNKKTYDIINSFDLTEILQNKSQCPSVRSICLGSDQNKLLIGTLASQIFQINFSSNLSKPTTAQGATNYVKGHYSPNNKWTNQVWGLCVDLQSSKFFTCSDDSTIRCWDLKSRKLLSVASLNYGPVKSDGSFNPLQKDKKTNDFSDASKGRVIALSPDKKQLFIGCKNGVIRIYKFNNKTNEMTYKLMFRKAKEQISDIKFIANTLVIGSHDNALYVYDYDQGNLKQRYKPLKKHSSYITHFDFSRDGSYLQSTCGAYELLFWDLNTGKQLPSGASMLKDQRWSTWTCTLGWPVQGIWPKYMDGTFINSVDRSQLSINGTSYKEDNISHYLLASGNDFGKVVIFNYPSLSKGSKGVEGKGHSSHVTNVKWSGDDKWVISTGGQDQCVMQWKVFKTKSKGKK